MREFVPFIICVLVTSDHRLPERDLQKSTSFWSTD